MVGAMLGGLVRRLRGGKTRVVLGERDVHCHIVPGVDDGSRTTEESLQILRLLAAEGVKTVIATPHIYPGRFDNEPEDLRPRFEALDAARHDAGIDVQIELGAEHWLDDSLLPRIAAGRVLPFGPERYVLFETTTGPHLPPRLYDVVHALADAGYTPLCAHVERYAYLREGEGDEILEDLRAAGARFQVNRTVGKANVPGEGTRGRFVAKLLTRGWVDEVGSDLHRPTPDGRPYSHTTRSPANTSP
jgi:tyrosine-protein phosphatase YwqE